MVELAKGEPPELVADPEVEIRIAIALYEQNDSEQVEKLYTKVKMASLESTKLFRKHLTARV